MHIRIDSDSVTLANAIESLLIATGHTNVGVWLMEDEDNA